MDLSKPWSGAYNTTNSQYGAFDGKAAASMHVVDHGVLEALHHRGASTGRRSSVPWSCCAPERRRQGHADHAADGRVRRPDEFGFAAVSHTTQAGRGPATPTASTATATRREAMQAAIARGEFVEYAQVHTNIYGTSVAGVKKVQAAGKCCVLDIDVQGAEWKLVKASDLNAVFVFIAPPSLQALEQRLRDRGTETEAKIQVRLANAAGELAYCDKPGFFDAVIVNDDVEAAYADFKALLQGGPPDGAHARGGARPRRRPEAKLATLMLVSDNLPEHELLIKARSRRRRSSPSSTTACRSPTSATPSARARRRAPPSTRWASSATARPVASACSSRSAAATSTWRTSRPTRRSRPSSRGSAASSSPAAASTCSAARWRPGPMASARLLAQVEALAGVTVTASTDKTGGAADADWEMETHGIQVGAQYFDVEALKKWKHTAIAPGGLGLGLAAVPVGFGAVTAALGGI